MRWQRDLIVGDQDERAFEEMTDELET